MSSLDKLNATDLLRLMSNYENMKLFRKDNTSDANLFWKNLIQNSGYSENHAVLSCKNEATVLPANEKQALFWEKASSILKQLKAKNMCLNESKLNLHECNSK